MENQESKNIQQIAESIKIEDLPMLEDITPQEQKGIFGGVDYSNESVGLNTLVPGR